MNKIPIINKIIKEARKEKGYTQPEFAHLINKGIATIRRYDAGSIIPHNTLILICDKLNLSFNDLREKQLQENKENNVNYYNNIMEMTDIDKAISDINSLDKIDLMVADMYNLFLSYSNKLNFCGSDKILKQTKVTYQAFKENGKIVVKQKVQNTDDQIFEKIIDIFPGDTFIKLFDFTQELFLLKLNDLREKQNKK